MATITRIKTDSNNYSRYDPQRNTVNATLYVTGALAGDIVTATLWREDGYGMVQSHSYVCAGGENYVRLLFPLENCKDPTYTHIYRAKSGIYSVRAGAITSPTFTVSLVSLRRMREEICRGLPLLTGETVGLQYQPRLITGLHVDSVQPDLPQDVYTFAYTNAGQTLSFAGGTAVPVGLGGKFTLIDANKMWWVRVSVDDTVLPTADTSESIVIAEQEMTDDAILAELGHAEADIADYLQIMLEPTQFATQNLADLIHAPGTFRINPPTNDFVDGIKSPVPYIRPPNMDNWINMKLPVRGLIQLEGLYGFLNNTQSVSLDQSWWLWDEKSALVQLVPSQGAAVSWQSYTGFFYSFLITGYDSVPNFWHWKATCGLRELRGREANTLQAVEYQAAINILRQAALHARPGYTAEGLARDGLSSNVTYAAGPGGIYSQTIQAYQQWLDQNKPEMRRNRRGLQIRFI